MLSEIRAADEVVPENWTGCQSVFHRLRDGYAMSTRRRFTGEFKAKVALEALRGDKTIQEIAVRPSMPPALRTWR